MQRQYFPPAQHIQRVILYYIPAGHSENELCTTACSGMVSALPKGDELHAIYSIDI